MPVEKGDSLQSGDSDPNERKCLLPNNYKNSNANSWGMP